jgi:hypothetical protein
LSAIRFYLDEDATQRDLLVALRARAADVSCALEVGLIAVSDLQQLEWCQREGRVLYTFNVGHFHALHSEFVTAGRLHAGIVLAPQQRFSIGEQMRRLLRLRATRSAEAMRNQIEFLTTWS